MTKKEFLESRNYVEYGASFGKTFKDFYAVINLTTSSFEIHNYKAIREQKDIDNLQIVFNNVKGDFEEVMKIWLEMNFLQYRNG